MADEESREGMITYKCMRCYTEMSVKRPREIRMDGMVCFLCSGPIQKVDNQKSVGTLTVDVDCSNALTGLKAVQREARKATQSLKELEEQQNKMHSSVDFGSDKDMTVYCRPEVSS